MRKEFALILVLVLVFACIPSALTAEGTAPPPPTELNTVDTTNPYSDCMNAADALNEAATAETNDPIYILVFGDEEVRSQMGYTPNGGPCFWDVYAQIQIERGDETLNVVYDLDVRILGILGWESDDNQRNMALLLNEFLAEEGYWIGQYCSGPWWSDNVDAIFGIVGQEVDGGWTGKGPPHAYVDQGNTGCLVKWYSYWADDNIVQHHITHLFYGEEHYFGCCNMADHTHYMLWVYEEAFYWVDGDVRCGLLSNTNCGGCHMVIDKYKTLYCNTTNSKFILRHEQTMAPHATFYMRAGSGYYEEWPAGVTWWSEPINLTICIELQSGYVFDKWLVNGVTEYPNQEITIYVNGRTALAAIYGPIHAPPYPGWFGFGGPGSRQAVWE